MTDPDTASRATVRVQFTEYENLYRPTRWDSHEVDWHDWASAVRPVPYLVKDSAPLWGMYTLRPGGGRSVNDVQAYYALALDFDDVPLERVADAAKAFEGARLTYLWHSTWSHCMPGKGERRRIIIPLAKPIDTRTYRLVMQAVAERYAPALDLNATQRSQAFFVPSYPPDMAEVVECFYVAGEPLDASQLVQTSPLRLVASDGELLEPTSHPEAVMVLDRSSWEALAKRWLKRAGVLDTDLGRRLQAVCDGIRFAHEGERDIMTWRLVSAMMRACPEASTDSVCELFAMSLSRMAEEDGESAVTEHSLRSKIDRARTAYLDSIEKVCPQRMASIRLAFDSGRTHPYSLDERQTIADWLGLQHTEDLTQRWIYQHERQYYFVAPGPRIESCQREAFDNVARVLLAPAVDLYAVTKDGHVQMPRQAVLEQYSTPVSRVRYSLTAQQPRCTDGVLTLPACPVREIAPQYDEQIQEWLRLLAGDRLGVLMQWLANLTALDKPLAALVLTGPASCGKSMLALGLSRLWSVEGPTSLAQAMGTFQGALFKNPYVTADEGEIPKDGRGTERTEDLRQLIQATSRQINMKHRDEVPLEGACRLQISANNDDVLALGAALSGNDIDAIAARFLHVPASMQAVQYLADLGGRAGTESWVSGDGIAAHVLWMRDTVGVEWQGRFGVPTQGGMVDRMLVRNGLRAQVCELCLRALRDPQPLTTGALVIGSDMMIRADWVLDSWETWLRRIRQPTQSGLIKALDGLGDRVTIDGEGWWTIPPVRLYAAGSESGAGTPGRINEWLMSKTS